MARPTKPEGDPKLIALFEEFGGRLVSPGGAAGLLGVSRKTIHTLSARGELRTYTSDKADDSWGPFGLIKTSGPRWVYIPLDDVHAYGAKVGRRVSGA